MVMKYIISKMLFQYVMDLTITSSSLRDCFFKLGIILSHNTGSKNTVVIHFATLLANNLLLDIICLPFDDSGNLYSIWSLKINIGGIHQVVDFHEGFPEELIRGDFTWGNSLEGMFLVQYLWQKYHVHRNKAEGRGLGVLQRSPKIFAKSVLLRIGKK